MVVVLLLQLQSRLSLTSSPDLRPVQGKVLARGDDFDRDQVVSVTNVSITYRKCVNLTIYKNECQVGRVSIYTCMYVCMFIYLNRKS